jgi:putative PIN family toxin of toxin-antitoxin system
MSAVGRPRVVFDRNVVVQAVSNDLGPAGRSLELLQRGIIEVFVSRSVLRELRAVLQYPIVRQKLAGLNELRLESFTTQLVFRTTLVRHVRHVFDYPRAQQDEPYIDPAAAARANFIVTRDKDLLALASDHFVLGKRFRQRLPGLRVLNPVAFLAVMDANEDRAI